MTLEPSARITADTAAVQALVESLSGVATAHTDADAGGADSDAEGNVDVRGLTEVLARSGLAGLRQQSVLSAPRTRTSASYGKPRATCSCGAADTDARANVEHRLDRAGHRPGRTRSSRPPNLDVEAKQVIALLRPRAEP